MGLQDITGKEIKIGQEVYFTMYKWHSLIKGTIEAIRPRTIVIKGEYVYPTIIRRSNVIDRVIIINN